MTELSPTWMWIIGGGLASAGAVIWWRFDAISREMKAAWGEIGRIRTDLHSSKDAQHAHEVEALKARLDLKDQITTILLANNTVSIDAKNTSAGVARLEEQLGQRMGRMEKQIDEIAKEVIRHEGPQH